MSGKHLDKMCEIGLKPALVEKCWLVTFIVICKLGIVTGACRGLVIPGPRGNCLIVCPLPNADIEECKNTSTAKLPAPTLATCKSITPQKRHLK